MTTVWFVSDQVGNPEGRFCCIAAHFDHGPADVVMFRGATYSFFCLILFWMSSFCCEFKFVCHDFAMCDLVPDVVTIFHLCKLLSANLY